MEEELASLQGRMEAQKWASFRCPTCQECSTGLKYQDWVSSDHPLYTFDASEPPPIYVDDSTGAGKPKFTLLQGIGPKTLEMDHSRSNRIYKPTLKGCVELVQPWQTLQPFQADEAPDAYAARMDTLMKSLMACCSAQDARSKGFVESVLSNVPLFRSPAREQLVSEAEDILLDLQADELERLRLGAPKDDPFEGLEARDEPFGAFM